MTQETAAIFAGFFYTVRLIQEAPNYYRVQVIANHPDGNDNQRESTATCITHAHAFFTKYVADVIESEQTLATQNPAEMRDIEEAHTELWQESYDRDASLREIIEQQKAQRQAS
jgi:hypothetical protein